MDEPSSLLISKTRHRGNSVLYSNIKRTPPESSSRESSKPKACQANQQGEDSDNNDLMLRLKNNYQNSDDHAFPGTDEASINDTNRTGSQANALLGSSFIKVNAGQETLQDDSTQYFRDPDQE